METLFRLKNESQPIKKETLNKAYDTRTSGGLIMILYDLDGISFRLKKARDFAWLKKYGNAFWALDETG